VATLGNALRAPGLVATLLAAMTQEHERAAGAWHSEWAPFSDLLTATASAAAWLRQSLTGLEVHLEPVEGDTLHAAELVDKALENR
jgi:3-carboxy-cis,cis-muconate cycloisomerase